MIAFLASPFDPAPGSATPPAPSPNALYQFQKDNRSHPWLHVTTDSGMVERKVQRLDPIGLHGLTTPERARLHGSISWDRIQRIDEVVTRATTWRNVGAATLGLLGAGLGNALGAPTRRGGRMALAGLIACGAAGGYLGSAYGSRFRSERNWYVADTTRHESPEEIAEAPSPAPEPSANPAVLAACDRIGRNELFRAHGSFGSFRGYAGIAGPEGLEQLRVGRGGHARTGDTTLQPRIPWSEIDRIEMRGGSATQGAVAGGTAFAALGALLGMAAVTVAGSDVSAAEAAFLGALYVAPVGMALGGLGGFAVRRWVVVYHRA